MHTHVRYTENSVIEITTATGGCGYVSVSWIVTDNDHDDGCSIGRFILTLSSVDITMSMISHMLFYNFTGLPVDTLFNFTVFGISLIGDSAICLASTSLRTLAIESMYV